ncbi:MAG: phage major capsid protein [Bacteroidetes bacterium]|nr:MAG: phage major capsid protein [Bacteroidota bacterium]
MATISPDVASSTLRRLVPRAVDQIFMGTPLLHHMTGGKVGSEGEGGKKNRAVDVVELVSGGKQVDVDVVVREHSNITQYSNGYENTNQTVRDVSETAVYNWCDYSGLVALSKKDELSNKGEAAQIKILEKRMKRVMSQLKREYEKASVAGLSTILSDLNSLYGLNSATGFLEEGTYGTGQSNTVGGLSKAATAFGGASNPFNNQSKSHDLSGTVDIDEDMTDLYQDCQDYSPDGSVPTLGLCTKEAFKAYKARLFPQERYVNPNDNTIFNAGRLELAFGLAGIRRSVDLDTLYSSITTSGQFRPLMYFINGEWLKPFFDEDAFFELMDFQKVSGKLVMSADIIVRVQNVAEHLGSQGVLYDTVP